MCLEKLIGLKGLCETSEGLLINNLAGVDLKMISNLSNEEMGDYSEVWETVKANAIAQLKSDVLPHMGKYIKQNVIQESSFSSYTSLAEQTTPQANYVGVIIDYWGTKFTQLYINDIRINLVSTGTYTVKVFDTWTGLTLDTITFTGVAGDNVVNVGKEYRIDNNRKRILVAIDATNLTAIQSRIDGSPQTILRGAAVPVPTLPLYDNINTSNNRTGGLSVSFNIQCSIESFICQFQGLLKYALWYKTGSVLMDFRINSDRLNKYTLVKQDAAKELRATYEEKYLQQLDNVLNSIEPVSDGICFPCDKSRTYKINLP